MNFESAQETATALLLDGLSVLIAGAPGIGKTALAETIAQQQGWKLILSHPVTADPTDYKGFPVVVEGRAEFLPFGELLDLMTTQEDTLWTFDDLIQAPQSVQAALMQLVHPNCRELNQRKLSNKVRILGCTNRRQDRAGGAGFIQPLKSRFVPLHLEVEPSAWIEWALRKSMSPFVAAYIRWRPNHLLIEHASSDLTGSPNPRSWEWVARVLRAGLSQHALRETLLSLLGEEVGTEFVQFLSIAATLPDLSEIANNPDAVPVPSDPTTLYAAVASLVGLSDRINPANVIRYVERLQEEFQVLFATFATSQNSSLASSSHFAQWVLRHQNAFGLRNHH